MWWLFVLGPGCHSSYVDNHDQAELILQLALNTNQSVVHCWRVVLSIGQVFDLKHEKYYHIVRHGWRATRFWCVKEALC
jgi:hypothetical protein